MVAPSRVHPLTFFGRAPRGTTNTDLCKELVKRFAQTDLRAVQDFGAGRFETVFRNKPMVDRFLADRVLKAKETEIKFEYRGVRTKIVRVLGYPCQDGEQALIQELGAYGKVLGVQHESVKDFALVPSGILRVRMEMNCPVPNLLKVDGRFAQCEYEAPVSPAPSEPASEGGGEGNSEQLFTLVTNKRSRRKRSLKTTRKPSPVPESSDSDSESGGSGGVPERKRTAVTESDEDSSATIVDGASSSGELKALCPMCGSSMCECSLLSDMSYPSTGDSPVKTEGPSVDS
ncbi:hypothetical protein HPB50_029065 [Hyalomma asiaticum]|nr:hypothetical protein HPB50_029065 [Hyalomma asiaticum]